MKRVSRALVLANEDRTSRGIEAHSRKVNAELTKSLEEVHALGTLIEQEIAVNAAVIGSAAAIEMAAAERMMQRAGTSRVAQVIAADRINRLTQADDRTMNRGGF